MDFVEINTINNNTHKTSEVKSARFFLCNNDDGVAN